MAGDPQFRLHQSDGAEPPRVSASGDIDLHNVEALQRLILDADSPALVVDLSAVTYCDSATLGVLLAAAKTTRLTLVVPAGGTTHRLITLTGLDRVANVVAR
ncbi:MAG TPA: STAS domain-containing protein [Mycobacterium sp.]|nr:STAS domain-containing protein [Mycolicibacterium sp.]HMZ13088.1 STAS domain-containing protein [Mycobacterium sp.]